MKELTPQQLDQALVATQRRIPIEVSSAVAFGAVALPMTYLSMIGEGSSFFAHADPETFARMTVLKGIFIAATIASVFGVVASANRAIQDLEQKRSILNTARERGLQVKGIIFNRIKQSSS